MALKPGERKVQILEVLAHMLEDPGGEKITTAALAGRLDVSEAALYRHFASKAQMYEGLIEFIETTVFGLANKIASEEISGVKQVESTLKMLLGFVLKNPGMTRVLTGDALVHENDRLQQRINQALDRIEATLKQSLRLAATRNEVASDLDPGAVANLLVAYVSGRWNLYAKTGFRRAPDELWLSQWQAISRMLKPC